MQKPKFDFQRRKGMEAKGTSNVQLSTLNVQRVDDIDFIGSRVRRRQSMVQGNSNMRILIVRVTAVQAAGEVMYKHFLKA